MSVHSAQRWCATDGPTVCVVVALSDTVLLETDATTERDALSQSRCRRSSLASRHRRHADVTGHCRTGHRSLNSQYCQLFDSEAVTNVAYMPTSGVFNMLICGSARVQLLRNLLMFMSIKLITSLEDEGLVELTYSVVEEQPAGTEIGDLLVDTGLIATANRSLINQIHFSVVPGKHK